MYPVASAIVVAAVLGTAEHRVSTFKVYRISRHLFRLIVAFGLAVGAVTGGLRDQSFEAA